MALELVMNKPYGPRVVKEVYEYDDFISDEKQKDVTYMIIFNDDLIGQVKEDNNNYYGYVDMSNSSQYEDFFVFGDMRRVVEKIKASTHNLINVDKSMKTLEDMFSLTVEYPKKVYDFDKVIIDIMHFFIFIQQESE